MLPSVFIIHECCDMWTFINWFLLRQCNISTYQTSWSIVSGWHVTGFLQCFHTSNDRVQSSKIGCPHKALDSASLKGPGIRFSINKLFSSIFSWWYSMHFWERENNVSEILHSIFKCRYWTKWCCFSLESLWMFRLNDPSLLVMTAIHFFEWMNKNWWQNSSF